MDSETLQCTEMSFLWCNTLKKGWVRKLEFRFILVSNVQNPQSTASYHIILQRRYLKPEWTHWWAKELWLEPWHSVCYSSLLFSPSVPRTAHYKHSVVTQRGCSPALCFAFWSELGYAGNSRCAEVRTQWESAVWTISKPLKHFSSPQHLHWLHSLPT